MLFLHLESDNSCLVIEIIYLLKHAPLCPQPGRIMKRKKSGTLRMHEQLIAEDNREIKRLGKRLGMKKGKTTQAMRDIGLSFILDHLDDGYDSDTGETRAPILKSKNSKRQKRKEIEEEEEDEEEEMDEEEAEEEGGSDEEEEEGKEEGEEEEMDSERTQDNAEEEESSFPPEELAAVTRRVRPLLNRIDEAQLPFVTRSLAELYGRFPRALLRRALAEALSERVSGGGGGSGLSRLLGPAPVSEQALLDAAACLAVLSPRADPDLLPVALERLLVCCEDTGVLPNLLLFSGFLFKLGAISSDIPFDLIEQLADHGTVASLKGASRGLLGESVVQSHISNILR